MATDAAAPVKPGLNVYAGPEALSRAAADLIAHRAAAAVAASGRFSIALAGGSTPRPTYERLAGSAYRDVPWRETLVFWGDERCVPPDQVDSNYRMARETLLDHVPVPPSNVYRMAGEEPPTEAAASYSAILRAVFDLTGDEWPRFDLILLGLGEDGHTASLFPHTDVLFEQDELTAAPYVPRLSAHRLTLTPPVLNNAALIVFLVTGAAKADVLRRVLRGPYQPEELPAQLVRPTHGTCMWVVGEEAAAELIS